MLGNTRLIVISNGRASRTGKQMLVIVLNHSQALKKEIQTGVKKKVQLQLCLLKCDVVILLLNTFMGDLVALFYFI